VTGIQNQRDKTESLSQPGGEKEAGSTAWTELGRSKGFKQDVGDVAQSRVLAYHVQIPGFDSQNKKKIIINK
jgi:hypothetical protein